ncbi:uncharacterized protein LOC114362306 [Ostrinia furnacalis]|uniref:uncharacterized protein LOC114362306 n=1 Tax=Ostrinia furnacalis TaxID=93504 RepID=UPI00103C4A1C|nr:uncharacterized protein LOC114362306 [Ostrinia furnacalis]
MMKRALIFVLFGVVWPYEKSTISYCLWHNNSCVDFCPEWMVEVKSDCAQSYWKSQRTCEHPDAMLVGTVCGFSRCDCPEHTVLDTETGYCYDVDNCPTKHSE